MEQIFHRERPETWERISIKLAFSLAQGSISFQSFPRILTTLVAQDRVDKPAGRGVVLRPCAKSSITIPREVARKAFEQEARLNSVYRGLISASITVASKSSTYVFGHFGTILVLDTPCAIFRWLVFIDDSHGQARNCICVENVLHKSHDTGCEDGARYTIGAGLSTSKVYNGRTHRVVEHRKDREESEPHGVAD